MVNEGDGQSENKAAVAERNVGFDAAAAVCREHVVDVLRLGPAVCEVPRDAEPGASDGWRGGGGGVFDASRGRGKNRHRDAESSY